VRAALTDIELLSDLHASADYRRRAAATLAVRATPMRYRAAEARMPVELNATADAHGKCRRGASTIIGRCMQVRQQLDNR